MLWWKTDSKISVEIKSRQIPVREYENGLKLVDDESALTGKNKAWTLTLKAELFERALISEMFNLLRRIKSNDNTVLVKINSLTLGQLAGSSLGKSNGYAKPPNMRG
jgi:hypothetical protein